MNSITPPTAPVPAVEKLDIRVLEDAFAGTTDREQLFFNIDFVCRIFPSSRSNRPAVLTLVAGMSKRMLALQRRGGGAALLAERPEAGPSADLTQASWPSREGLRRGLGSCGSGTPRPLSPARDYYRASGSSRLRPASPRQNTSTFTPPFRELIVAESVPLPPGAGHFAVGATELRHSVGRAAAEPYERLDNLSSLLCAVRPYGPPGPLWVQDFHRSLNCSYLLDKTQEAFKEELDAYIVHWNTGRRQVKLKGLTPKGFRLRSMAA